MTSVRRKNDRWIPFILAGCVVVLAIAAILAVSPPADARGKEEVYVPEIIEVEQPHAWCYVLRNDNSGAIRDINMLSCVPKGGNHTPIISEVEEDADS